MPSQAEKRLHLKYVVSNLSRISNTPQAEKRLHLKYAYQILYQVPATSVAKRVACTEYGSGVPVTASVAGL